jgi:RHS repeat-associated protein
MIPPGDRFSLGSVWPTVWSRTNGGIFTYANGTTYFNRTDNLGTPRVSTDYTGAVKRTETMGPFGDGFTESYAGLDFTGFAGGVWDQENNGDHFGAREYAKTPGRWLTPDPSGLAAVDPSNPQTWNRYAYVNNNPVSFTDPTGLKLCDGCHFLGSGGGGGDCNMDGVSTPCDLVNAALQGGGASPCPNNNCGIGTATPYYCLNTNCGYFSNQYIATHEYTCGLLPCTNGQYTDYLNGIQNGQRQAIVDQLTQALCAPGDAACAVRVNDGVSLNRAIGNNGLQGGNYNFALDPNIQGMLDLSGCIDLRCGSFDTLDFSHGVGNVHMDTANPYSFWGVGALVHGFVDYFLGSTLLSAGIPR